MPNPKPLLLVLALLLGLRSPSQAQQPADSTATIQGYQARLVALEHRLDRLQDKLDQILLNDQAIGATANNIVAWTGFVLTAFVFLLGAGAWFTGNRFNEIEKIRRELKEVLEMRKKEIAEEKNTIQDLYAQFEQERDIRMKIVFPVLEGQWFYYQGNRDRAIAAFQEAYQLAPQESLIVEQLGKFFMEKGQIYEAIQLYEPLVNSQPSALLWNRLAQAYRRVQRFDDAQKALMASLALEPDRVTALYELGRIYMDVDDFSNAEKYFSQAKHSHYAKHKTYPPYILINLALSQLALDREAEAMVNAELARPIIDGELAKRPGVADLWTYLGIYHLIKKHDRSALSAFQKAQKASIPPGHIPSFKLRVNLATRNRKTNDSITQIHAILNKVDPA